MVHSLPNTETGAAPTDRRSRVTVVILFGGRSSEHAISCVTAAGVMSALDRERFHPIPVGITRNGRWVLAEGDLDRWRIHDGALPEVTDDAGPSVLPWVSTDDRVVRVFQDDGTVRDLAHADVVFPLLHGPYGEDGTIQGLLELSDTPYVGPGVLSSALAMDKYFTKVVLDDAGIPQAPHVGCLPRQWEQDPQGIRDAVAELGYPVFVKPARAGSSMGVSKVSDPSGLDAAVEAARAHDPKVIIEAAIVGREIECAVIETLDGSGPATSLLGEIEVVDAAHDFYDFEAKYLDDDAAALICPAELDDDVVARVQDLARRTFIAMGCEGLARVDTFVRADGSVIVNELNTMPGFTPISMYPRMWERSGMSYSALVERLIDLALARRVGLR